jgi:glucose/arabinose dehydrogenase
MQFPKDYNGDAFLAEHGSWDRARRTGYKVIRVVIRDGKATGEYDDFMTGFVTGSGDVWGRPVGVAVGHDGSLFVTGCRRHCLAHFLSRVARTAVMINLPVHL